MLVNNSQKIFQRLKQMTIEERNIEHKRYLINYGEIKSVFDEVLVKLLADRIVGNTYYVTTDRKDMMPITIIDIRLGNSMCIHDDRRVIGFEVESDEEIHEWDSYCLSQLRNQIKREILSN